MRAGLLHFLEKHLLDGHVPVLERHRVSGYLLGCCRALVVHLQERDAELERRLHARVGALRDTRSAQGLVLWA